MIPQLVTTLSLIFLWPVVGAKTVIISVAGQSYGSKASSAEVGDLIEVSFTVGTASFTESTLDEPCVPKPGGLDSGTITIPPGAGPKQFRFTLQTSDPIFFFNFANQNTNACEEGFVGTINASSQQASEFLERAQSFNPNEDVTTPSPPATITVTKVTKVPTPSVAFNPPTKSSSFSFSPTTQLPPSPSSAPVNSSDVGAIPSSSSNPEAPEAPETSASITPSSSSSSPSASSPTSSSSQSHQSESRLPPAILAVIGGLMGMVGLGLAVLGFLAYRRKTFAGDESARLSSRDATGTSSSTGTIKSFLARYRIPRSWPLQSWQRLGDTEESSITPFIVPTSVIHSTVLPPPVPPKPSVLQENIRRISDATTLVSGVYPISPAGLSEPDHTYASESVQPPSLGKRLSSGARPFVKATQHNSFPSMAANSIV